MGIVRFWCIFSSGFDLQRHHCCYATQITRTRERVLIRKRCPVFTFC